MFKNIFFNEINKVKPSVNKGNVILSFDIDWAPDFVILDLIDILKKYNLKHTFFVTHNSELLKSYQSNKNVEYGLHPNFDYLLNGNDANGKNPKDVIKNVQKNYSNLNVIRSHTLTSSSRLSKLFFELGYIYESNILFHNYNHKFLPFVDFEKVCKVPISWEDDVWLILKDNHETNKILKKDILNVFNFHPIHIFLNSPSYQYYETNKNYLKNESQLLKKRFLGFGIRNILLSILEKLTK